VHRRRAPRSRPKGQNMSDAIGRLVDQLHKIEDEIEQRLDEHRA
jgi:hypothetical protein